MISNSPNSKVKSKLWLPSGVVAAPSPVVAASAGSASNVNADALNITVSGIVAGNLLIATVHSLLPFTFTGWTFLAQGGTTPSADISQIWARIATGSGDNFDNTAADTRFSYSAQVLRITGHGVTTIASDLKLSAYSLNAGANGGNPPSLDAGSSKNWLWIAEMGMTGNTSGNITAAPSTFTLVPVQNSGGGSPKIVGYAYLESTASQTVDPGNFTHTAPSEPTTKAITLAIPPAP